VDPERTRALAFRPGGKGLAIAGGKDAVVLLEEDARGQLGVFRELNLFRWRTGPEITSWNHGLVFSPDGRLLAGCGGSPLLDGSAVGEVWLWDITAGRQAATLRARGGSFQSLAFSPDGKFLAAGGSDGAVRLWDVRAISEAGK
jgi:WD40 repeat protein